MQRVEVQLGERSYPIDIGSEFSPLLPSLASRKQVVIVSNPTVAKLHLEQACTLFNQPVEVFLLPDGEAFKTLSSFEQVLSFLLEKKVSRQVLLVALGGGVIGDMTGFVAACYQRGVDFIQIPTTLLAQVDSSVGGKTAVNHPLGKNMIGAFKQPEQVIINTTVLSTLPIREFAAGMAEVVKYALIADVAFLDWLEHNLPAIQSQQPAVMAEMIRHCCQMKADIVARDETEQGDRALLNLGHTFGHAIEAFLGFGQWLHGEAVATGMVMAARLSLSRGWLQQAEVARIESLLTALGLPVNSPTGIADLLPFMKTDKKVFQGQMRFILPVALGVSKVITDVTEKELLQVFA